MSTATSSEDLSHCLIKTGQNMGQVSERGNRNRTRRHVLRAQALLTLLACGPLNRSQLARIIAAHTGRKPESVRRALEGDRDVLRALEDAWLIEKTSQGLLVITPLGIRAIENTVPIGPLLPRAAARIEEWEPALRGLSCVIAYVQSEYWRVNTPVGVVLHHLLRTLPSILAQDKHPRFEGDTSLEVLESLDRSFFPHTMEALIDLSKEYYKTRSIPDLNNIIKEHIDHVSRDIRETIKRASESAVKCRHGKCSQEEEKYIEGLFEGGDDYGLLIELAALRPDFVEQATRWPSGRPPLRARLALREAGGLLRDLEVSHVIAGLSHCSQENKLSGLLATLLSVHAVVRLVLALEDAYTDLDALSRHSGTLALVFTNLKGESMRQTLAFLLLLRDVIARFREYWIDVMLDLQGIKRRNRGSHFPRLGDIL